MLNYIEYLNLPSKVAIYLVFIFLLMQICGELLEFKGKVVPEFMKVRKYVHRKKEERIALKDLPVVLEDVKKSLAEFDAHYSKDNIQRRNEWIEAVNYQLEQNKNSIEEFNKKLDKNNADTLALLIDSKRNTIINFASVVVDGKTPVTREQYNRIFKLYKEYETIIEENGLTNGEVDIAYRIVTESYEEHMRSHSFVENIRGYDG